MSNPISVSFGGDVEVKELNPSEVPVDLDLYSFLKNKSDLNFVFLNCPFTNEEQVYLKTKDYVDGFDFEPIDYKDGTFESISLSALCGQEELNLEVFKNIISTFEKPFLLREKNCFNFLYAFDSLPESFKQKTLIYFFYKNPALISKEDFCEEKMSELKDISQIMKSFDGLIIKQAV